MIFNLHKQICECAHDLSVAATDFVCSECVRLLDLYVLRSSGSDGELYVFLTSSFSFMSDGIAMPSLEK